MTVKLIYALPSAFATSLWPRAQTTAKTTACVRATVVREPPAGRERRTPGVRTKNSRPANRAIFHIFDSRRENILKTDFPINRYNNSKK